MKTRKQVAVNQKGQVIKIDKRIILCNPYNINDRIEYEEGTI